MTTNEINARLKESAEPQSLAGETLRDYLGGLQYNLAEHPLDAAAYAGTAHCRELLGDSPATVLEYYVLSLKLDGENMDTWKRLSHFSARRAGNIQAPVINYPEIIETAHKAPARSATKIELFWLSLKNTKDRKLIAFLLSCVAVGYIIMARAFR